MSRTIDTRVSDGVLFGWRPASGNSLTRKVNDRINSCESLWIGLGVVGIVLTGNDIAIERRETIGIASKRDDRRRAWKVLSRAPGRQIRPLRLSLPASSLSGYAECTDCALLRHACSAACRAGSAIDGSTCNPMSRSS